MFSGIKKKFNVFIPPFFVFLYHRLFDKYGWFGNYSSWAEVEKKCKGYNNEIIFDKVREAALKVKNGDAFYERDSVIFDKIEYSWPLLTFLLWVGSKKAGKLSIVDFGGGLGSTFQQNIGFLSHFEQLSWNIVEQQHFVSVGKKEFETEKLKFHYSVAECIDKIQFADVLLLSSVLQYLEDPYGKLEELLDLNFEYIIIDKMPFNDTEKDRLTIQKVPKEIYDAEYPCWILSESKFLRAFKSKYKLHNGFMTGMSILIDGVKCDYKGFLFVKN